MTLHNSRFQRYRPFVRGSPGHRVDSPHWADNADFDLLFDV